jgi:TetR/AcrR family fatty acid metabolism transcriptional regulator
MPPKPQSHKRKKPTFIEAARRKQIIEATIDTIAAHGLAQTSLAEIAKEADISKGVISYHFDSKDELIEQTLDTLLAQENAYIKSQVEAQNTAADRLRAYAKASFDYMLANRNKTVAMWELWGNFDSVDEKRRFSATVYDPCRRHLTKIIRQGQNSGEFRSFPVHTAASIILAAIDGLAIQWVCDAEALDPDACLRELEEILALYTSRRREK